MLRDTPPPLTYFNEIEALTISARRLLALRLRKAVFFFLLIVLF
jgi:hypothetical protein